MSSNKNVDKLADGLKDLVIGASGNIPGYSHDEIKLMVEKCGAKFVHMNIRDCTHLVTTNTSVARNLRKVALADEEGCQIVTMDWLLQSIKKQVPEKAKKYLLKKTSKKEAPSKIQTNKRGREDDGEKEDLVNAIAKKSRDDRMIQRRVHRAGLVSLVDDNYDQKSGSHAVWLDDLGFIWDATLVRMGKNGHSRVIRLQIIHDETEINVLPWICHRHCTGHVAITDMEDSDEEYSNVKHKNNSRYSIQTAGEHVSLRSAKKMFLSSFRHYTGLEWCSRDCMPRHGYWIFLDMGYAETLVMRDDIVQLDPQVKPIMKMIFQSSHLTAYTSMLKAKGYDVQLKTTEQQRKLRIGLACLEKLMQLLQSKVAWHAEYQLDKISHEMIKGSTGYLARKSEAIKIELESLDLLQKLHDANEILKTSRMASLSLSKVSYALGVAKMDPVDEDSAEFIALCKYLHNTSSKHHQCQFKEVLGIFRLKRPGEAERFSAWEKAGKGRSGDRRLLWHGSACANFAGILIQGLRGSGIVSPNGKSFCRGIYFADMSTKSAGYMKASPAAECLLLLCEVELGTADDVSKKITGATTHNAWRDAGYIHPDFKNVLVPDARAGRKEDKEYTGYYHWEYVAYNPAQVIQRYLFHIKMK
ncbi:unnamed protein product [Penicillium bialowiezense]